MQQPESERKEEKNFFCLKKAFSEKNEENKFLIATEKEKKGTSFLARCLHVPKQTFSFDLREKEREKERRKGKKKEREREKERKNEKRKERKKKRSSCLLVLGQTRERKKFFQSLLRPLFIFSSSLSLFLSFFAFPPFFLSFFLSFSLSFFPRGFF